MKVITISGKKISVPETVQELTDLGSQSFYRWQAEKLGNDLFINDPDRAERIAVAAESGGDGSTHAEHIEDFREYADMVFNKLERDLFRDEENPINDAIVDQAWINVLDALDDLENWHSENGSLNSQVG